ncbi:MAG TPA: response regulator [Chitinophagaceae bacterium]|nr:response regulator [Chitinophagaceae bacterium]
MESPIKILVVEDEMIIAAKISMHLTNLGYEVTGILPRGEEALLGIEENKPDIVIMDIRLKGDMNGIDTAIRMQKNTDIAVIFLTANADEGTFNKAKAAKPHAFISKPYKQLDLQRAIELTISRLAGEENKLTGFDSGDSGQPFVLSDRIFVRQREKMIKIFLADILYIMADRNYCRIFTKTHEYLLCVTLKAIEEKLDNRIFLRVHRSYTINLSHIDAVAEDHVIINQKAMPVSEGLKEKLLQRIRTL